MKQEAAVCYARSKFNAKKEAFESRGKKKEEEKEKDDAPIFQLDKVLNHLRNVHAHTSPSVFSLGTAFLRLSWNFFVVRYSCGSCARSSYC